MRIGELAAATGCTSKTLRFYEASGLLPSPARSDGGYRDYPPETTHRVAFIRRGQNAGLRLAQIRQVLDIRDAGTPPCEHVHDLLQARLNDLDRQIADLMALRTTLVQLNDSAATPDPRSCPPGQVCRYI